jgi:hypothetical protein
VGAAGTASRSPAAALPVPGSRPARRTRRATPGVQERLGRADQAGDPEESGTQGGVVGGVEATQVGVDQAAPQGPSTLDAGVDQVAADGDVPGHVDHAGQVGEEGARPRGAGCRWRWRVSASSAATVMPWP